MNIALIRNTLQEVRELGLRGFLFRAGWELKNRTVLPELLDKHHRRRVEANLAKGLSASRWVEKLPIASPSDITEKLLTRIPKDSLGRLRTIALEAMEGRVLCFGRWTAPFGRPIDWHLNPQTGLRWDPATHGSRVLRSKPTPGDIKFTWEVARFPQAYHLARASCFFPGRTDQFAQSLADQIAHFVEQNPYGYGAHWASGQEVAFRLLAWVFAARVLFADGSLGHDVLKSIAQALVYGATHIEQNIDYARNAVHNNHLLSEALALYLAGHLLPEYADAKRWHHKGREILEEQAERQFYPDGGYIQQSHNYHRVALQVMLWAYTVAKVTDERPPEVFRCALERSLDFLTAQQNPQDGRLPNYGANDGALPSVLSTCDYSDFRPTLQAVSLATPGERLYQSGPWGEEAAWFFGAEAFDAPVRQPHRTSVSFAYTGHHILRGNGPGNFGLFRCGTIKDRFSQIDMLHLDVWWRGQNVLVDGGSYLYNGPSKWHNHFSRTESHNTAEIAGIDQMLHHRQFKNLYWTRADVSSFEDTEQYALCSGEHYGYQRQAGRFIHQRSVLFVKDDVWVIVDRVTGKGTPTIRLHWLGGPFVHKERRSTLWLNTPEGVVSITLMDGAGSRLPTNVVSGQKEPPRGWLSRYYGEKAPVPSLTTNSSAALPTTFVSVCCPEATSWTTEGDQWTFVSETKTTTFRMVDGCICNIDVETDDAT